MRNDKRRLSDAIAEVEQKAELAIKRAKNRNYYQGAALGAIVTTLIFVSLIFIF